MKIAVEEIINSKSVKETVNKTQNNTIKKAKDKIQQAKTRRENLIKKT